MILIINNYYQLLMVALEMTSHLNDFKMWLSWPNSNLTGFRLTQTDSQKHTEILSGREKDKRCTHFGLFIINE